MRGPQVRPPAPGLDRRGGRALGPGLVQHPGTLAAFTALTEAGGPGKPLEAVLEAAATETDRRFLRGLAVEAFAAEEPGVR